MKLSTVKIGQISHIPLYTAQANFQAAVDVPKLFTVLYQI